MTQGRSQAGVFGLSLSKVMVITWLSMIMSGLCVVVSSHECRLLYSQLALLEQDKTRLEVARGQYLLEESSLASLHRVETFARQKLSMEVLPFNELVVVKP